jgi:hypothetical protein
MNKWKRDCVMGCSFENPVTYAAHSKQQIVLHETVIGVVGVAERCTVIMDKKYF